MKDKHWQETQGTQMGAEKLAENSPNVPNIVQPNLHAQAQKFEIFKIKVISGCPIP